MSMQLTNAMTGLILPSQPSVANLWSRVVLLVQRNTVYSEHFTFCIQFSVLCDHFCFSVSPSTRMSLESFWITGKIFEMYPLEGEKKRRRGAVRSLWRLWEYGRPPGNSSCHGLWAWTRLYHRVPRCPLYHVKCAMKPRSRVSKQWRWKA